jgi:hypothetical protein
MRRKRKNERESEESVAVCLSKRTGSAVRDIRVTWQRKTDRERERERVCVKKMCVPKSVSIPEVVDALQKVCIDLDLCGIREELV